MICQSIFAPPSLSLSLQNVISNPSSLSYFQIGMVLMWSILILLVEAFSKTWS